MAKSDKSAKSAMPAAKRYVCVTKTFHDNRFFNPGEVYVTASPVSKHFKAEGTKPVKELQAKQAKEAEAAQQQPTSYGELTERKAKQAKDLLG